MHALAWAARGFRVFPCLPDNPDTAIDHQKRPAIKNFAALATTDEATIRGWWAEQDYNIGLSPDQGHLFIDVDVGDGKKGDESLAWLDMLEVLPRGLRNRTRSGGLHIILTKPTDVYIGQQNGWMAGIDLRGDGKNYILAPGSTVGGEPYTNLGGEPEPAPIALLDMMRKPAPTEIPDRHNPLVELDADSSIRRAIEYLRTEAPTALQGAHGDDTTVAVAMRLGDLGISREVQLDLMLEHWQEIGKAEPPWNPSDLQGKIDSAWRSRTNRPGCACPGAVFDDVSAGVTGVERPRPASVQSRALLPIITASDLAGKPVPPRPWHVENWIPGRNVTQLSGDGGTGKSAIALQLAAATALGLDWLGLPVTRGRVLYLSAEDELDEVHRRLAEICDGIGADLGHLSDLRVSPVAGEDAILAAPEDRSSILKPTKLWHRLEQEIADWPPKLLLIDTQSDVFAGMENDRAQARQFVGMLRQLALRYDTAAVLCSHPSLTGLNSGTGTSGSTGWNNSVRSRIYLSRVQARDGSEPDPDLRVLSTKKLNYGRLGQEIRLRWTMGVFCPADTATSQQAVAEEQERIDRIFLELLAAYEAQGRTVGSAPTVNYAPAVFAKEDRAKGIGKRGLSDAMNRLFAAGRIRVEEHGPPSKRRRKMVVV